MRAPRARALGLALALAALTLTLALAGAPPTTAKPTKKPTKGTPTTLAPTSHAPSSATPTAGAPTTAAPATAAPSAHPTATIVTVPTTPAPTTGTLAPTAPTAPTPTAAPTGDQGSSVTVGPAPQLFYGGDFWESPDGSTVFAFAAGGNLVFLFNGQLEWQSFTTCLSSIPECALALLPSGAFAIGGTDPEYLIDSVSPNTTLTVTTGRVTIEGGGLTFLDLRAGGSNTGSPSAPGTGQPTAFVPPATGNASAPSSAPATAPSPAPTKPTDADDL